MNHPAWCVASTAGMRLMIQVVPNAKKTEIGGPWDTALKIRLQAPPVDGKANEALIAYISQILGVPKRAVVLVRGHTSKRKLLEIRTTELSVATVVHILLDHIA